MPAGHGVNTDAVPAVEWESLLGRKPMLLDRTRTAAAITGKRILITGAGGWIGSALTRAAAAFAPQQLVLLEAGEHKLYEIVMALEQEPIAIQPILGSITHRALMERVFREHRPQIVFHAAAFKHVPLMEQNPFAAIENNALGTNVVFQIAAAHGAEHFILLSTDKAADPVSIMGASKRIAELVLLAAAAAPTRSKAVRLGNVLGSEGSVVPLFQRQILAGKPVTITHPEARRYFLTTSDAVTLLLHASSMEKEATESEAGACAAGGGTILVPDLGEPILLQSLLRHLTAHRQGISGDVRVVFTQLRPGDKLCESLLSSRERYLSPASEASLRPIASPALGQAALDEVLEQLKQACSEQALEKLLAAVLRAVPEYRPSALIEQAVKARA